MRWLVVVGVWVVVCSPLMGGSTPIRAITVQTVQVSESGFNPSVCKMNRDFVRFENVGTTPRRVIRPGIIPGQEPLFDTGVLEPGEVSNAFAIPYGGTTVFFDAEDMSRSVTVVTPVFVEQWEVVCTPDPEVVAPEPACPAEMFCLRLPALARDS